MDLLPPNATDFERSVSLASDFGGRLNPPVTGMRGIKLIGTPPSWLPFLVYEYDLGELSPYVPNLYELIAQGIGWQRVRGTPQAIALGLGWLGYGGTIEEAPVRRRRWHLFQLALDRVRDAEVPDLERIEGITQLSVPLRSQFWRGFRTYDVRELEYGYRSWGNAMWSACSGPRLADGHAKWSFGRVYELDHTMTEAELTALGAWIAPVGSGFTRTWSAEPWPHAPWAGMSEQERRQRIIDDLFAKTAWITYCDADGDVIGHRRARAWARVRPAAAGAPYRVGNSWREPTVGGDATALYAEAITDFGDGFGRIVAKWQVRLGAVLVDPSRPGLLWAEPGDLTGGIVAVEKQDTIEFGRTVRERCRALLRIA